VREPEEHSDAHFAHLYERVAAHISELIAHGTLRPGDRIPSVRRLSRQQGVSITTVVEAYLHLDNGGLMEARPQSGHYVRARRASVPPLPRAARAWTSAARVSVSFVEKVTPGRVDEITPGSDLTIVATG
jgi:DNA-binding FadR family transcriptional regulator